MLFTVKASVFGSVLESTVNGYKAARDTARAAINAGASMVTISFHRVLLAAMYPTPRPLSSGVTAAIQAKAARAAAKSCGITVDK